MMAVEAALLGALLVLRPIQTENSVELEAVMVNSGTKPISVNWDTHRQPDFELYGTSFEKLKPTITQEPAGTSAPKEANFRLSPNEEKILATYRIVRTLSGLKSVWNLNYHRITADYHYGPLTDGLYMATIATGKLSARAKFSLPAHQEEFRHEGKIKSIRLGMEHDGNNTMIVDDYPILIDYPRGISDMPTPPQGSLIGFGEFGEHQTKEAAKKLVGKKVEIFVGLERTLDGEAMPTPHYTLFGNSKYYIKLK